MTNGKWLATATTSILLLVLLGHNVAFAEEDSEPPDNNHGTHSETEPTKNPRILVEGTTRIVPSDTTATTDATDARTETFLEDMLRAWEDSNPPPERMGCSARSRQRQHTEKERARASATTSNFASLRQAFRNNHQPPPNNVQAHHHERAREDTIRLVDN